MSMVQGVGKRAQEGLLRMGAVVTVIGVLIGWGVGTTLKSASVAAPAANGKLFELETYLYRSAGGSFNWLFFWLIATPFLAFGVVLCAVGMLWPDLTADLSGRDTQKE
jgi:hypothetical protein